jgi:hypothetical protein
MGKKPTLLLATILVSSVLQSRCTPFLSFTAVHSVKESTSPSTEAPMPIPLTQSQNHPIPLHPQTAFPAPSAGNLPFRSVEVKLKVTLSYQESHVSPTQAQQNEVTSLVLDPFESVPGPLCGPDCSARWCYLIQQYVCTYGGC